MTFASELSDAVLEKLRRHSLRVIVWAFTAQRSSS